MKIFKQIAAFLFGHKHNRTSNNYIPSKVSLSHLQNAMKHIPLVVKADAKSYTPRQIKANYKTGWFK